MTSHIFGRSTAGSLPVAAKGDGCYIVDTNGKRYFDGSGGAAVSCLGHSDADVTAAIKEQTGSPLPIPASSPPNRRKIWRTF